MQKLIYIANARIPTEKAHGIQIMKMCEAFAQNNLDVELIVPRRFNPIKENPYKYYSVKKIFKITYLPCLDLIPLNLKQIGLFIQTISFLVSAKLYLLFKKYDLLYTREQLTVLFFKRCNLEMHYFPNKVRLIHKIVWQKAKNIITTTNNLKKILSRNNVKSEKIFVFSNGVDLKEFDAKLSKRAARKKLFFPLDKIIITYTGSIALYKWKGVDFFLDTICWHFNNDTKYLFVLIGGTNNEISLLSKKYRSSNILFVPRQRREKMAVFLNASDALILPNTSDNNESLLFTSPLKLFEYMSVGRVIIASKLPSILEIVNNRTALLFKPNNKDDLASKINYLKHASKEKVNQLEKNIFRKSRYYSLDSRTKSIMKIIAK